MAMDKELKSALRDCPLFEGVAARDLEEAVAALGAREERYEDDDVLLHFGQCTTRLGIVVEQRVRIEFYDEGGNASTIARIGRSGAFGEAIACAGNPSIVQVVAVGPARVLWVDMGRAMSKNAMLKSRFSGIVMANVVQMLARKNMVLNQKMQIVSQKRLRDRIKLYLAVRESDLGGSQMRAPMTRNELAAFLNVDRSSLSRELGRMRDEGLVNLDGNKIEVARADLF